MLDIPLSLALKPHDACSYNPFLTVPVVLMHRYIVSTASDQAVTPSPVSIGYCVRKRRFSDGNPFHLNNLPNDFTSHWRIATRQALPNPAMQIVRSLRVFSRRWSWLISDCLITSWWEGWILFPFPNEAGSEEQRDENHQTSGDDDLPPASSVPTVSLLHG